MEESPQAVGQSQWNQGHSEYISKTFKHHMQDLMYVKLPALRRKKQAASLSRNTLLVLTRLQTKENSRPVCDDCKQLLGGKPVGYFLTLGLGPSCGQAQCYQRGQHFTNDSQDELFKSRWIAAMFNAHS